MLVIPVMLGIKKSIVTEASPSIVNLLEAVIQNLDDKMPVVQRTASRLLLELKKQYDEYLPEILKKFEDPELRSQANQVLKYDVRLIDPDGVSDEEEATSQEDEESEVESPTKTQ